MFQADKIIHGKHNMPSELTPLTSFLPRVEVPIVSLHKYLLDKLFIHSDQFLVSPVLSSLTFTDPIHLSMFRSSAKPTFPMASTNWNSTREVLPLHSTNWASKRERCSASVAKTVTNIWSYIWGQWLRAQLSMAFHPPIHTVKAFKQYYANILKLILLQKKFVIK